MRFLQLIGFDKVARLKVSRTAKQIYRFALEIEREKLRRHGRMTAKPKRLRIAIRMMKLYLRSSRRKIRVEPPAQLPSWIIRELRLIAEKERAVFPSVDLLDQFKSWTAPQDPTQGIAYAHAITSLNRANYQVIVLAPWLKQGGADKGIIQFCKAYSEATNVLLITTLDENSPWLQRLPERVEALTLGPIIRSLPEPDAKLVLGRLLLQLSPKLIHIVQSQLGWETVLSHPLSLRALDCKLIGSLFSEEIHPDGSPYGYAVDYPLYCGPVMRHRVALVTPLFLIP